MYKSTSLYVDDGYKSQLLDKGSGVQSAIIIGLFQYYTRYVNTLTSALLCIEEPELYLHPHARKVISHRLDDFLDGGKHQVIIATHSEDFLQTATNDLNILLLRKENNETKAAPVASRQFRHLLIFDQQYELFFADKIIVCEGYNDFILKGLANELFPGKLAEQNISVISVGNKNQISHVAKLALQLGIKCFVFADFSYLLRDESATAKEHGAQPEEHLLSLGGEFFDQPCTFGSTGAKAYQFIEKLRTQIKDTDEDSFYTAKSAAQINHQNMQQVLDRLRSNGVCILSSEFETLAKDFNFLSPSNKLSLEKIYALQQRILQGEQFSDLFLTSEIRDFLRIVFER